MSSAVGAGSAGTGAVEGFAKAMRRRLLSLLVLSIADGVLEQLFADAEIADLLPFVAGLAITVLIISWCNVDARGRDFTIKPWLFATMFLLTCVGVPIYLLRTRGARGILSILFALLFFVLMVVLGVLAAQITRFLM